MTTVFLHAWVPQLGPVAQLTPFEQRLMHAAATARAGRFRTAAAELNALQANEARERYLLTVFHHLVEVERFQFIDGARVQPAYQLPVDLDAVDREEQKALAALLPELADQSKDAAYLMNYEVGVDQALQDVAALMRQREVARNTALYGPSAAAMHPNYDALRIAYKRINDQSVDNGLLSRVDADVFDLIVEGRWARGRGDMAAATAAFEHALAAAPKSATAEILIDLGDTHAAPAGSPLLLGTDPASGGMMRSLLDRAIRPAALAPPSADEIRIAREAYARAADAAGDDAALQRRIAVRRAYLLWREQNEAGAVHELEQQIGGRDVAAWSAAACLGALRNRRDALRDGLSSAFAEDAVGIAASFTELAQTVALSESAIAGNRTPAIVLLENLTDVLEESPVPRLAVDALNELTSLYNAGGRRDAAVVTARRGILLMQRHVQIAERFDPVNLQHERMVLSQLQEQQHTVSGSRRVEEQTGGWTQDALSTYKQFEEHFDRMSEALPILKIVMPEETKRAIRIVELKIAMDEARAAGDCAARLPLLRKVREQTIAAGIGSWCLLYFDQTNADCEPSWLAADRKEYEQRDIAAPIAARLAATEAPPADSIVADMEEAMGVLEMLQAAEGWDALHRDAIALDAVIDRTPYLAAFAVPVRHYGARAALEAGKPLDARHMIDETIADPLWPSRPATERMSMLGDAVEAEGALCDPPSADCSAARALYTLELFSHTRFEAQIDRSGVFGGWKESAERAALEAHVARTETIEPADLARLRQLRAEAAAEQFQREPAPAPKDVDDVIAALPPNLTVLAYHLGRQQLLVWRIRKGELRLVRVPNRDRRIEQLAAALEDELGAALDDQWRELRNQLYASLIEPVGGIPAEDDVFILANGALASLPFEVLAKKGARELIFDHAIVYGSRIGRARETSANVARPAAALAVGINSSSLTTAEDEARLVAKLLGASPLVGTHATTTAVQKRLSGARWVHLATHATLVAENPFESYFTLAAGERLEAWRLFRNAPAARLITLSACEAAAPPRALAGKAAAVSESNSLVSFAFAGNAQFVLASLWRADDRSAFRLMQSFYKSLSEGQSEAAALRNAKLRLAEGSTVHPYYYANFILTARSLATFVAASRPE